MIRRSIRKNQVLVLILFSFMLSLIVSILPIFGVSSYKLDSSLTSCSIDWKERSIHSIIYVIFLYLFVYIIPLFIIFITNLNTVLVVRFYV